ncbi:hypothetical protein [Rhodovulum sp. 12E13]|uniref:hypothetical protein n=1 Tax=Rhodovulum sp. 12E13 TaxID=2203891 RepID=UPI0011C07E52|nr:hypothetical protein [Rhodovulum sp. 12E13]
MVFLGRRRFSLARRDARGPAPAARDWAVRTDTRTILTSTPPAFHVCRDLDVYKGGGRVFCRAWNVSLPQDVV